MKYIKSISIPTIIWLNVFFIVFSMTSFVLEVAVDSGGNVNRLGILFANFFPILNFPWPLIAPDFVFVLAGMCINSFLWALLVERIIYLIRRGLHLL